MALSAYNQKKMRHRRRQGQEGLVTSRFSLDGDRSPCHEPDVLVYGTASVLAFTVGQCKGMPLEFKSYLYYTGMHFSFSFCYARKRALQICCFISMLCAD